MRNWRPAYTVYLIGIALMGLTQDMLKQRIESDGVFFSLCIGYAITLRLIADAVERYLAKRRGNVQ